MFSTIISRVIFPAVSMLRAESREPAYLDGETLNRIARSYSAARRELVKNNLRYHALTSLFLVGACVGKYTWGTCSE